MIFPTNAVILAVAATTKVAGASHIVAEAEENAKRQARLLRGLISQIAMSLPNTDTQSTKTDGIIIDSNEGEDDDDHKSSVEFEPDDGVLSLSLDKLIINPKIFLKEIVSQFLVDVEVAGVNNDNDVDEIMKKFENLQNWKDLSLVDKVVVVSFGTVGVLGLNNKITEEQSIAILSSVVSKANDLEESAIDEGGVVRRLQPFTTEQSIDFLNHLLSEEVDDEKKSIIVDEVVGRYLQSGTNDNLFVAYIRVSVLKLQGLDDASILDRLTMVFTKRVVDIVAGVLGDPTPPQPTNLPTSAPTSAPTSQPTNEPTPSPTAAALAKLAEKCEETDDCVPCKKCYNVCIFELIFCLSSNIVFASCILISSITDVGGERGPSGGDPGTTYCNLTYCFCFPGPNTPVGGCCNVDGNCSSSNCDFSQVPLDGYGKCVE